jgi:hypothetical protein
MLRKGLQDELKEQKHNATGKLSRGLKYHIKDSILSIYSSVSYWKTVNNPKFAKRVNYKTILSWVRRKRFSADPEEAAALITGKLNSKHPSKSHLWYGKPYVRWTEGNSLKRTDFSGYTARKYKEKVAQELAPSIGKDVASMIRSQIRKNNPKAIVS